LSSFTNGAGALDSQPEHNGRIPRDFWLAEWGNNVILNFQELYSLEGYGD
jgi:hypothetical protein